MNEFEMEMPNDESAQYNIERDSRVIKAEEYRKQINELQERNN